jgi:NAD(P)-dependent dehydrogenase (short-subunit alcohol dehydrogenase family)
MSPEITAGGLAFRGKVAVITGVSGGIGEAIAVALTREGARLLLAGR